jgi:hypothetical protein
MSLPRYLLDFKTRFKSLKKKKKKKIAPFDRFTTKYKKKRDRKNIGERVNKENSCTFALLMNLQLFIRKKKKSESGKYLDGSM